MHRELVAIPRQARSSIVRFTVVRKLAVVYHLRQGSGRKSCRIVKGLEYTNVNMCLEYRHVYYGPLILSPSSQTGYQLGSTTRRTKH